MKLWTLGIVSAAVLVAGCGGGDVDQAGQNRNMPDTLKPGNVAQFLEAEDPEIRAMIARNIGEMGAKASSSVPALEQLLDDPDPQVREAAREALTKIRGQ